ncbi:MAG: c-type cytochrome [Gemmatimonadota bacterium]
MSARRLAVAAVLLAVSGCNWWYNDVPSPDDAVKAIPWFDHMITSRSVAPYQRADIPRYAVAGTVPLAKAPGQVVVPEADWRVGDPANLQYGFDTLTANRLVNPTDPQARDIQAMGDTLYHTYCAMCHGDTGAGDGTVSRYIGAPSLLTPRARGYTDGYLYSIIRYGRGVMPQYGDKIYRPVGRWAVVNYVRRLQSMAPAEGVANAGGMN